MNVVIVNCFDTYEHRVDLLYKVLTEQGNKVKVLTSNYRHIEKIKRTEKKKNFILFDALPYKKNMSPERLYSHYKLSKDIFSYVEKRINKIDLLWVLVPPNSFVKDAAKIKRNNPKLKLIFDLIDLWPETMPISKFKTVWPFSMWKNLRDDYLREADCIVTECNLFRKKLKKVLEGKKTEVLYLAREKSDVKRVDNRPDDQINLCYLGSINNIIDIPEIARICKQLMEKKPVCLHIIGDGEKRNQLISAVEETGAKVEYHGKIYDAQEKQDIFNQCHFGLNIMKDSVCVGLTMKSMDYFEAGLPIINNIHGDTWWFVEEYKLGINIDDLDIDKDIYSEAIVLFFDKTLSIDTFEKRINAIWKKCV